VLAAFMSPLTFGKENQTPVQPAQTPLAQAQTELERGNPAGAVSLLVGWLESHPNDVRARTTLGSAYLAEGQTARAETEFRSALKVAPNDLQAIMALGSLYDQSGQLEKAEPLFARAAKLAQNAAAIRLAWATVLARLHRYSEAEAALSGVAPPAPLEQRIAYHRLKASTAMGLGKKGTAAAEMEQALRASPQQGDLQLATGVAEAQAGNWARANELLQPLFLQTRDPRTGLFLLEAQIATRRDFQSTLAALRQAKLTSDQELDLHIRLGETLSRHGVDAEAAREFEQAVALSPDQPDLLYDLALAQFRAGKFDEAFATTQKAKAKGDNAELEDLIGDVEEQRGDSLAAVRSYQGAVALAPTQEDYHLSLGLELVRHKSFEPALLVFQQAADLFPTSARLHMALGMTYFLMGRYADATRTLLRATDLGPDPTLAFEYLGETLSYGTESPRPDALKKLCDYSDAHPRESKLAAYCGALLFRKAYAAGETSEAPKIIDRLEKVARLSPRDPTPPCQLGKAYEWVGRWPEALREWQECARLQPDSSEAHYRLARLYQRLGEKDQARKEMELQAAAAHQLAKETESRDANLKTFVYELRNPPQK
jgi:Flp pilus assembly protein TadD